jgi:hypothetical protein
LAEAYKIRGLAYAGKGDKTKADADRAESERLSR